MNWRRIKRILFWPESNKDVEYIINKRKERLELYERVIHAKQLCKQKKLNKKIYSAFRREETELCNGDACPLKIRCLFKYTLKMYNDYEIFAWLNYPFMSDLSIEWENAPFWKDYEIWKKLQELNKDFKL